VGTKRSHERVTPGRYRNGADLRLRVPRLSERPHGVVKLQQPHRSPDSILVHYIEHLPTTIRDVVLARCCQSFNRLQLDQHQDLFATFRAIVSAPDVECRAYTCARMIGVLELAFQDEFASTHADLALRLEQSGRLAGSLDLQTPIAQKHWGVAREEFFALRRDVLAVDALHQMLVVTPEGRRPAGVER
jgi:hypothetical protein